MRNNGIMKGTNIPLYVGLYQRILQMIRNGEFEERLPSEPELSALLSVSRNTLRQALQVLEEDRIIYKRRGAGTYVSKIDPLLQRGSLGTYAPIEDFFASLGVEAELANLIITIEEADDLTSKYLSVEMNSPVVVVSRLYRRRGEPLMSYAQLLDFIPQKHYQGLSRLENKIDYIRVMEERSAVAQCEIIATRAGKLNADIMKVSENTPLTLLLQVVMDKEGNKLYLNKTYLNSQATDIVLTVNRR
jgi:GntR family transcriptional regulator